MKNQKIKDIEKRRIQSGLKIFLNQCPIFLFWSMGFFQFSCSFPQNDSFQKDRLIRFILPSRSKKRESLLASVYQYRIQFKDERDEKIIKAGESFSLLLGNRPMILLAFPEPQKKSRENRFGWKLLPAGSIYIPESRKTTYRFRWEEGAPALFLKNLEKQGSTLPYRLNLRRFLREYIQKSPQNPWLVDTDFLREKLNLHQINQMSSFFFKKKKFYIRSFSFLPHLKNSTLSSNLSTEPICLFSENLFLAPICPDAEGRYLLKLPRGQHRLKNRTNSFQAEIFIESSFQENRSRWNYIIYKGALSEGRDLPVNRRKSTAFEIGVRL